jgi:hypothetical protein
METATAVTINDPTCVSIRVDDTAEIRQDDKIIHEIRHSGMSYAPGRIIPVQDGLFRIESIEKKGPGLYYLYSMETSDSSIFLTPMLFNTRSQVMWDTYFMNVFLWMEDAPTMRLHVLLRKGYTDAFNALETIIKNHDDFVDRLEVDDFSVMYVFNVPMIYEDDFLKFVKGKYSQMSDAYKVRILDFHSMKKTHEVYGILYRTDKRKTKVEERIGEDLPDSAELYHIIDEDRETYKTRYRIFRSQAMG